MRPTPLPSDLRLTHGTEPAAAAGRDACHVLREPCACGRPGLEQLPPSRAGARGAAARPRRGASGEDAQARQRRPRPHGEHVSILTAHTRLEIASVEVHDRVQDGALVPPSRAALLTVSITRGLLMLRSSGGVQRASQRDFFAAAVPGAARGHAGRYGPVVVVRRTQQLDRRPIDPRERRSS